MELNEVNVHLTMKASLFDEGSDTSKAIIVEGIRARYGFDPEKIEKQRESISSMLDCLHDDFKQSGGGGQSVTVAHMDKSGNQWTILPHLVEALMCLGMAIGKAGLCAPRDFWKVLPGGMPYYFVKDV